MQAFRFLSLDSTNLEAIRFAQKSEGINSDPLKLGGASLPLIGSFLFTADYQTAGRGQRGHAWTAPWGGLYASILYPVCPAGETTEESRVSLSAGQISLLSSWSVFQTIENVLVRFGSNKSCKNLEIRWPNDLYLNQRKIAGILTESARPGWLVTGIGINVNADLPDDVNNLEYRPIGIKQVLNRRVELDLVLQVLLDNWQNNIQLAQQNSVLLAQNVEARLAFVGKSVLFSRPERPEIPPISGTFLGIDEQGFARLQTARGERLFPSGRIRLC